MKGVGPADAAETATGAPIPAAEVEQLQSLPLPLGSADGSPATPRGLAVVPLGLPGGKARGAAAAEGQPGALFWGAWQGWHCISVHGQEQASAVAFPTY